MFFGFPHGGGGDMDGGPPEKVDNDGFYTALGVAKDATQDDIKKAFKKLAIKHHPDKGGDEEQFKVICKAYEVLSDPEKRQQYDSYGEAGLSGSTRNATDIFEMFFGGMGQKQRNQVRRGENLVQNLNFTLEQFFHGATRKLAITRTVLCRTCEGKGGPESAIISCGECRGLGVKVILRRMGPMVAQTQMTCDTCTGTGKIIPADKRCKACGGNRATREKKTLEVVLPRGAPDGHKIVFSGEADAAVNTVTGDVIFVCQQTEHATFKRRREHLFMLKTISLKQALTGTGFYIKGIDGENKYVKGVKGQVIKPGQELGVPNEGMPIGGSGFTRGFLVIKFEVEYPNTLTDQEVRQLAACLPGKARENPPSSDDVEVLTLSPFSPQTAGAHHGGSEDDEDDDGHPGGVQCRQA